MKRVLDALEPWTGSLLWIALVAIVVFGGWLAFQWDTPKWMDDDDDRTSQR